jgi:hypothetical protein
MADLRLDIAVIPTYNSQTLGIADTSYYPSPSYISTPSIEITVPAFDKVTLPFNVNSFNLFNSTSLGITDVGDTLLPLPDGVYRLRYSVAPAYENFVERTIMRVDALQEKFDSAFMRIDLMECDRALKMQDKVQLNSIYFFIQGSIAAANKCAIQEANKLYNQADKMLNNFIKGGCQCSGTNYVTNFY